MSWLVLYSIFKLEPFHLVSASLAAGLVQARTMSKKGLQNGSSWRVAPKLMSQRSWIRAPPLIKYYFLLVGCCILGNNCKKINTSLPGSPISQANFADQQHLWPDRGWWVYGTCLPVIQKQESVPGQAWAVTGSQWGLNCLMKSYAEHPRIYIVLKVNDSIVTHSEWNMCSSPFQHTLLFEDLIAFCHTLLRFSFGSGEWRDGQESCLINTMPCHTIHTFIYWKYWSKICFRTTGRIPQSMIDIWWGVALYMMPMSHTKTKNISPATHVQLHCLRKRGRCFKIQQDDGSVSAWTSRHWLYWNGNQCRNTCLKWRAWKLQSRFKPSW